MPLHVGQALTVEGFSGGHGTAANAAMLSMARIGAPCQGNPFWAHFSDKLSIQLPTAVTGEGFGFAKNFISVQKQ